MSMNFIILEPDPIVCMDLEGMLISRYPSSHIAQGSSLSDVGAAIYNCGPDTILFVRSTLIEDGGDLTRVLTTAAVRGSHVIVIGQERDLKFPAVFVDLPFTTDMVFAAVDPEMRPKDDDAGGAMV